MLREAELCTALVQLFSNFGKHGAEHLLRQPACIGVVAGTVIAVVETESLGQRVLCAMGKRVGGPSEASCRNCAFMGDAPESDNNFEARQGFEARFQECAAGFYFIAYGFVLWRHATHGIGDHAIDQLKAIVRPCLVNATRESEIEKRLVEKITGIITRERTARAVGALKPRRQTDDEQPGARRTERRYGGIEPIRILVAVLLPKGDEPRAKCAIWIGFRRVLHGSAGLVGGLVGRLNLSPHPKDRRNRRHLHAHSRRPGRHYRAGLGRVAGVRTDRARFL